MVVKFSTKTLMKKVVKEVSKKVGEKGTRKITDTKNLNPLKDYNKYLKNKDYSIKGDKYIESSNLNLSPNDSEISKKYNPDSQYLKDVRNPDIKPEKKDYNENLINRGCPIEGNGGNWIGEAGNSKWIPKDEEIPKKYNPNNKLWKEIKEEYKIDGIEFKNGEPDFSPISKGEVKIDSFTDNRRTNFIQADAIFAKENGINTSEVAKFRKENGFTWHECKDCKTMQLVPNEVHLNIPHSGGISEFKSKNNS